MGPSVEHSEPACRPQSLAKGRVGDGFPSRKPGVTQNTDALELPRAVPRECQNHLFL